MLVNSPSIPLNPCDYFLFSGYRAFESRDQVLGFAMLVLELEGEIEPQRIYEALRRAMKIHPSTAARIGYTRFTRRPCWTGWDEQDDPATAAFSYEDHRGEPDWASRLSTQYGEMIGAPIDLGRAPLVRVDYRALPGNLGQICLRWPHELMDGEGAVAFLAEIDRLDRSAQSDLPHELLPDGECPDLLAGTTWMQRLKLIRRARATYAPYLSSQCPPLFTCPHSDAGGVQVRHRVFERDEVAPVLAHRTNPTPSDPARPSLYLAACVIRALHRLYVSRKVQTEVYPVVLTRSTRAPGPRPVHGNYLTWLPLNGHRERVHDVRLLVEELHEQFSRHLNSDSGKMQWAFLRILGKLPAAKYVKLLKNTGRGPIGASGFSYFSKHPPGFNTFLGARITNRWCTLAAPAPPGLLPAFQTYRDRLNFVLSWQRNWISDAWAEEFASEIEKGITVRRP